MPSSKRHLFRTSGLVLTALLAVPLLNGCGADANSSDPLCLVLVVFAVVGVAANAVVLCDHFENL